MSKTVKKNGKSYNHFSFEEREIVALELAKKTPQKEIARILNRSPSSVSREIWRNSGRMQHREYKASRAQSYSANRALVSHAKDRLKNSQIREYTIEKLKIGWTPEQIAGRIDRDLPNQTISYEAIYQYIYNDAKHLIKYLPRSHRKRQKRGINKGKRIGKIPNRTSIEMRPAEINERSTDGHWEADTMVSKQSAATLVVMRERRMQITFIVKTKNRSAIEIKKAIVNRLKHLPPYLRKSITFDNGTENVLHEEIAFELNLRTFFCNPYHSWEKGSVENTNGLIRRYLPKKRDFSLISDEQIQNIEEALNNRPRKSLGFSTPYELLQNCA
jgi:transposase, IS30 family